MRRNLDGIVLLEPWCASDDSAQAFEAELRREIAPGHRFYGRKPIALARRADCDDVLFITEDEPMLVAVVHLTYSNIREVDTRWPSVRVYETLEEWAAVGMVRDHEEFMA